MNRMLKTLSIASIIHHLDMTGAGYLWNGLRRGCHHDGSKSLANQSPTKSLLVIIFDPVHTQVRDIERHVEPYGKVLHVRICRNFAFVQFDTQEESSSGYTFEQDTRQDSLRSTL